MKAIPGGRLGVAVFAFIALAGCSEAPLLLDEDPARRTILQRSLDELPGSDGRYFIRLGDITADQILLSIEPKHGRPLVHRRSVMVNDVVPFELGGRRYFLFVVQLRNFLSGDDFAVVDVSTSAPIVPPATSAPATG